MKTEFPLEESIHSKIRTQIETSSENAIILNPAYLDDEQLSRKRQFNVLTEIFNSNVRSNEISDICSHFSPIIKERHPIHLSVLGTTGTGKTITLLYLLHEFEQLCNERSISFVQYHLDLCCPVPCFRALNNLACLIGASKHYKRGISLDDLMTAIESRLKDVPGYIVIFIDEADNIRRDQDTFYKFLVKRLPQRIAGNLILVFTSNKFDWTQNLDPRIKSCLKMREILFKSYDADSLKKILRIRIEKALRPDSVEEGVLEKIAAISSQHHGDARKAVSLLLRSAQIAERNGHNVVIDCVDSAKEEIERDKYFEMIRTCPKQLQAALYAAMSAVKKNTAYLHTGDVYLAYERFCQSVQLGPLTQRAFTDLLSELDMCGLIRARTVSRGRYGRSKEINVSIPNSIVENMKELILLNIGAGR